MSLVPSEIEYQTDSETPRESARIPGVVVLILLAILGSGFASVGYLAFDEMNGGEIRIAHAPDTEETPVRVSNGSGVEGDNVGAQDTLTSAGNDIATQHTPDPDVSNVSETADAAPGSDDDEEIVVAQSAGTETLIEPAPSLAIEPPTIKPTTGRAPTVTYDPGVFDEAPIADNPPPEETPETQPQEADADLAPEPQREDAPATESADTQTQETTPPAVADAVPEQPSAPVVAEPAETAPAAAPAESTEDIDPLSGSHVVQLASYRTDDEATADWRRIEARLGDYLSGKTYQIERADLGERGVFHRLRIGPFASSDDAQSYCQGLMDRGQDCLALRR